MAFCLFAGLMLLALMVGRSVIAQDWRTASAEPVGLAPDPAATPEAVVQVYGARTWGWRGNFGVHTWGAVKPEKASPYTGYEVIGWGRRGSDTLAGTPNPPGDARRHG